jgi:hypothetical protein
LNIPSVAANQAYYTPGQTAPTSNTLNTNQRAPTPVNQSQVGWRAADPNLSSGNSTQQNDSRSVLTNQTKFVETTPPANRNINQLVLMSGRIRLVLLELMPLWCELQVERTQLERTRNSNSHFEIKQTTQCRPNRLMLKTVFINLRQDTQDS